MNKNIKQFSVVDVETTGFSGRDKICEIAIVTMDAKTLAVTDEFETLINPQRDTGPVHVHNITAQMVADAPTFQDIARVVAERLNGSVLVAHNLPFDSRMIAQEFDELNAVFDSGQGVCTYNLTRENLARAAEQNGIVYTNHHRASEDARVTAELFRLLYKGRETMAPARVVAARALPCAEVVVREYH